MSRKTTAPMPLFNITEVNAAPKVNFVFDGRNLSAPQGISVAAALLINGSGHFRRTPVTASPRAAFCMMGVCFDCLVEVDGVPNKQACQISIKEGMIIDVQDGAALLPSTMQEEENE